MRRRTAFLGSVVALILVVAGFGAWYVLLRPSIGGDGVPHCKIVRESSTELTFVVSDVSVDGVPWRDVTIRLVNVSTPYGHPLVFAPTIEGLQSGNGQMTGPFKNAGVATQIDCSLTNVYGSFGIGEGDSFTIIPNGTSLEGGLLYEVSLFNEPYGAAMGALQFRA